VTYPLRECGSHWKECFRIRVPDGDDDRSDRIEHEIEDDVVDAADHERRVTTDVLCDDLSAELGEFVMVILGVAGMTGL